MPINPYNTPHNHVMIDIETYDTKPTAVILSIGACLIGNSSICFYAEIDVATQFERTASIATKEWWAQQQNPPIYGAAPLYHALDGLALWIKTNTEGEPIIWCKGTDFDTAILANAFNQLYIPVPWKYNNVRDCRTVYKVTGHTPIEAQHNAVQDAQEQAKDLVEVMSMHGLLWN